jgi:hypothetical protein
LKPLPEQVVDDLLWTLDTVIRPDLTDGFAIEQAGLMSGLLEHLALRIRLEHALLIEDSADLRASLANNGELVSVAAGNDGIDGLRAENAALTELLERTLGELEQRSGEGSNDELLVLRGAARRQLDRQRTMLGRGYAAGS